MGEAIRPPGIIWSSLAVEQMSHLPPAVGEGFLTVLDRLAPFPERFPRLQFAGREGYRQINLAQYRLIYRYFPETHLVRIYTVQALWRPIPPEEFLRHLHF